MTLLGAIHQADRSEPPVRAAALLRIARVLAATDRPEAERMLDRGLALLAQLPEPARAAITPQAICLAACVSPRHALALHATVTDAPESDKFLIDMARHGHAQTAVEYLKDWPADREFPYGSAMVLMSYAKDDDSRLAVLRSALHASKAGESTWQALRSVLELLRFQWQRLPEDEARDELRRIVRTISARIDEPLNASFGGLRGIVTFSSQRPSLLFQLLRPLQRLDPDLASRSIAQHPELARAARIYPDGPDTDLDVPAEPLTAEAQEQWERDWMGFALASRFFRLADEKTSDFKESFDEALSALARDEDPRHPNTAPRECWPSTEDFRTILYTAGRYEGASGARLLERIPDPAIRLFAEIEFAAGLAGLEQIGGITREQL